MSFTSVDHINNKAAFLKLQSNLKNPETLKRLKRDNIYSTILPFLMPSQMVSLIGIPGHNRKSTNQN